jgi:hypothetical protein
MQPRRWTREGWAVRRREAGAEVVLAGPVSFGLRASMHRVGAGYSVTSCDLRILMDQPTKAISSHDPRRRRQGDWHGGSEWRFLLQGAVRAVAVVMVGVLGRHRPQLPAADDQHPVQQLPPDGADPPLGVGVRPRRSQRRAQHPDPLGREDRVERGSELRVPVAEQKPEAPTRSSSTMSRLGACWATHSAAGCAVTPGTWTRRLATSSTNSTYSRCRNTVSTVKQVHRQEAVGLGAEELPPGQRRPLGRRFDAGPMQDGPDGAGPDLVAEAAQLTVDATVAPGRVLPGQPQHQIADLQCHAWTTTPVWVAPAAPNQIAMPAQQRLGPDEHPVPARAR